MEWVLNPDVTEAMTGSRLQLEFARQMGLDGIAVSLDGNNATIDPKHYRDEWGVVRVSYDEYPTPVEFPVKSEEDFKKLVIPDPDADFRYNAIREALKEAEGEIAIVARVKDVFSQPRDLMGFEDFLMSFYLQPELAAMLMDMCVSYSTRVAANLKELGVEIVVIGDDIANNTGLLLSPDMYREQVLPYFGALVKNLKAAGLIVIKHSDGDLRVVVDDLVGTGIDCLDPIDPLGHMDMAYMKQHYGNRIALKGNVDCVETLVSKSIEDVRRETAQCMLEGSIGGGHIISSSNSIHRGINPVNYRAFIEAVKEFGTYPLDVQRLKAVAESN